MEEQRKERTFDELAAENESLKAEVERLQQQADMLRKAQRQVQCCIHWSSAQK